MKKPSPFNPKANPILWAWVARMTIVAALKFGINLNEDDVLHLANGALVAYGALELAYHWVLRRRVVPIHPSTGETVGTAAVAAGIPLASPKGT